MSAGQDLHCWVCGAASELLDVVDFNKSCEEQRGQFIKLSGVPIYYALCPRCGFCFAPEFAHWSREAFAERIYNDGYVVADPDYREARPRANADYLINLLGDGVKSVRHLDYGGGNGLLASLLREAGWQSQSYDPYAEGSLALEALGRFELITALEVFEHAPDVQGLMAHLGRLLAPGGMVLFTTVLSDGHIARHQRLDWWYAAPRNGHISLYSRASLHWLAQQHGYQFGSFSSSLHLFCTEPPCWARHLFSSK